MQPAVLVRLALLLALLLPGVTRARTFTDVTGRTLEADLAGVDKDGRVLLSINGKVTPVPWDRLSARDQRYVKSWQADRKLQGLSEFSSAAIEQAAQPRPVTPAPVARRPADKVAADPSFPRSKEEVKQTVKTILDRRDPSLNDGEQAALNRLNAFRYLCHLPHDVTINRDFQPFVDGAARICRAIGRLDHGPPNPGWPEDDYQRARKGAGSSNLFATSGGGDISIAAGSVTAYMDDGATNPNLGHRRWCLNPRMGATAFGAHEGYSAMWAMDGSGSAGDWDFVAFPAPGYFPREFFGERYQWNITFNPETTHGMGEVTADRVKVFPLRRNADVPDDRMEPLRLEYFNVNLDGFGVANSIGFLPEGVELDKGERYRVEIHGLKRKGPDPLVYIVEFF